MTAIGHTAQPDLSVLCQSPRVASPTPRATPGLAERPLTASDRRDEVRAWVRAIAEQRDRNAFAALFKLFAPKVKAYLMLRGLDGPAAESLAERVFLAAWREAPHVPRPGTTVAAWLVRLAIRELVAANRIAAEIR